MNRPPARIRITLLTKWGEALANPSPWGEGSQTLLFSLVPSLWGEG